MRVRPWSDREKQSSIVPVVHALSHKNEISVIKENYTNHKKKFVYHFDQVFTNFSTQEELFEVTPGGCAFGALQGQGMVRVLL